MSNLTARTFAIWTSDNRVIRTIDLTKVDLDGTRCRPFRSTNRRPSLIWPA